MNKTITNNIERIADHFGFSVRKSQKCYLGCCPVHSGDNESALNFYHTGHTTIGNWQCKTHSCEEVFGKGSVGFIRGLLSVQKYNWGPGSKKIVSFAEAVLWCEKFLGVKYENQSLGSDISYMINRLCVKPESTSSFRITQKQYTNSGLIFPDKYFLNRGYCNTTLREFGVGFCDNQHKPMYNRAIVPLYDYDGSAIVGCSGRIIWDKCSICDCHHNPKGICPTKGKKHTYPKWKNSSDFPSGSQLYNFHRAKPSISKTGIVILTEGQPNVWRLHEAGFSMSLGCFGAKFSLNQKKLLDSSGAHTIIIVPDADEASEKFNQKIINMCKKSYNIITIEPSYEDDIGACNIATVKEILSPFIEKYREYNDRN